MQYDRLELKRIGLWCEALKSGRYGNTTRELNYLRRGDFYSVWGVACDVSATNGVWVPVEKDFYNIDIYAYVHAGGDNFPYNTQYPPLRVVEWYGMSESTMEKIMTRGAMCYDLHGGTPWYDNYGLAGLLQHFVKYGEFSY